MSNDFYLFKELMALAERIKHEGLNLNYFYLKDFQKDFYNFVYFLVYINDTIFNYRKINIKFDIYDINMLTQLQEDDII